jgi:hypothetical protein
LQTQALPVVSLTMSEPSNAQEQKSLSREDVNCEESKDEEFLGDMEDDDDEYSAAGDEKFKELPASANGDL